jgi:hypothetical protein
MLNKKLSLITLFSIVTLMSIFSIGRTPLGPLNVEGDGNPNLTVVSVSLIPSTLNFSNFSERIRIREVTAYVDNIVSETRKFEINMHSRMNIKDTGDFRLLAGDGFASGDYDESEDAFYIKTKSGSLANKYRLTGLTISGSKMIPNQTAPDNTQVTLSLDKIDSATEEVGIFTSTTYEVGSFNSSVYTSPPFNLNDTLPSNNDLNSSTFSLDKKVFAYSENITTFRLRSSHSFYFSSMIFEYSIDYSSCPIVA